MSNEPYNLYGYGASCDTRPFAADYRRSAGGFANSWRWRCRYCIAAAIWLLLCGSEDRCSHYGASSNPDDWSQRPRALNRPMEKTGIKLGSLPTSLTLITRMYRRRFRFYRRAVQLNPRSPFYKLDLASALEMSGDNAEAEKYYREAQKFYPISAEVSWRYGNFLLRSTAFARSLCRDSLAPSTVDPADAAGGVPSPGAAILTRKFFSIKILPKYHAGRGSGEALNSSLHLNERGTADSGAYNGIIWPCPETHSLIWRKTASSS